MAATRYELVKVNLAALYYLQVFEVIPRTVLDDARLVASVIRLERKGFNNAEAIGIAAEWHGKDPSSAEAIYRKMQEPIELNLVDAYYSLDEGEDEAPE